MRSMNLLILEIKRAETPFFRFLKSLARFLVRPRAPRIPGWLKPLLRIVYELHFLVVRVCRLLITVLYRSPVFQARCASVGKNVTIDGLPFVTGHVEIHIGDNVLLGGNLNISTGRQVDRPQLVIQNNAEIGWNVSISVSREGIIEEHARLSYDCRISDSDGHPRQADRREQNQPPDLRDIRPVHICRNAWIGNGTHIMKGVTIGEGAIIGANSVVISDIPPYALALGNPAEVYFPSAGRPSKKREAAR